MGKMLALTAYQAARILGVGKSTIYRRTATGVLKSKEIAGQLMIPLSALKKEFKNYSSYYEKIKEYLEAGLDPVTGEPSGRDAASPAKKQPAKRPCQKAAAKKGAKK
ncbi:MAG: helix-turn-helix domain-containing protein [Thermoguttaceae bacterium]|nr:helix-turn-helix domain-containing protein [Thermoguttaceae bacterium]